MARRGLKVGLQAAPVFDSLCLPSNCSPVCSPASNVLAFDATSRRAGALRERTEAECDSAEGNPIACAPPLQKAVGAYAFAPCSRSQAVTSPARQRVHRAPFLIGCGKLAAAIFRRIVDSPRPVRCSTTSMRKSASGMRAACKVWAGGVRCFCVETEDRDPQDSACSVAVWIFFHSSAGTFTVTQFPAPACRRLGSLWLHCSSSRRRAVMRHSLQR